MAGLAWCGGPDQREQKKRGTDESEEEAIDSDGTGDDAAPLDPIADLQRERKNLEQQVKASFCAWRRALRLSTASASDLRAAIRRKRQCRAAAAADPDWNIIANASAPPRRSIVRFQSSLKSVLGELSYVFDPDGFRDARNF